MEAVIKIQDGYWTYNEKKLSDCSFPERQVVSTFIKNTMFSIEVNNNELNIVEPKVFTIEERDYNIEFVKL
jgi:hypothetical protein